MTFDDHVQVDVDLLEGGLLVFSDQRAHVEQNLEIAQRQACRILKLESLIELKMGFKADLSVKHFQLEKRFKVDRFADQGKWSDKEANCRRLTIGI